MYQNLCVCVSAEVCSGPHVPCTVVYTKLCVCVSSELRSDPHIRWTCQYIKLCVCVCLPDCVMMPTSVGFVVRQCAPVPILLP